MNIAWNCDAFVQTVTLAESVLKHVGLFRQHDPRATEGGGQLFGTIAGEEVLVSDATGPYPGDYRSRYAYRSDANAAAKVIKKLESRGRLYLGEWHTHAEPYPHPSGEDIATMSGLVQKSTLAAGAAMMLIVGTATPPAGMYLGTFSAGKFHQWTPSARESPKCRVVNWIKTLKA